MMIDTNNIMMDCSNEDAVAVGFGVASGTMKYEELLSWIRQHRI